MQHLCNEKVIFMELKEFLEDSGMRQSELARRAKVPQHTISRLKSGKEVNLSTAIRVCIATKGKVTAEDLYKTLIARQDMENRKDHKEKEKPKQNKHKPKVRVGA